MRKNERFLLKTVLFAAVSFAVYFLLDFPIRVSGAYRFPDGIGVKSFLPFSIGLFLGPAGTVGTALGAFASGLVLKASPAVITAEVLCVLLIGAGKWLGWFLVNRDGNVRVERKRDFAISVAQNSVLSLVAAAITAAFLGRELFLPTLAGYLVCGTLVSMLVDILMGGIFCMEPPLPPWCKREADIEFAIPAETSAIASVNEMTEEKAMMKKIPMKRVFEIENCMEELLIRICKGLPETEIRGRINFGTTISMRLTVPGGKFNPLKGDEGADEMDLISLKLIRHRTLRASYSYRQNENRIHVIV